MYKKIYRIISKLISILFILLILLLFLFTDNHMIVSGSMEEELHHNDRCSSLKLNFPKRNYTNTNLPFPLKRQNIIIFQVPGESELKIKRIIGLPEEQVELNGYHVLINNKVIF